MLVNKGSDNQNSTVYCLFVKDQPHGLATQILSNEANEQKVSVM
jgi:hypothetical protein